MKNWNDDEVISLFKTVENCKLAGESLTLAFVDHAKKFNRKPNSVRNYYYHEIDALKADKARRERLGITLEKHFKTHFAGFDKASENDLYQKIETLVEKGHSVRSACLNLSQGNLPLMTRYQNKYQNMKRKVQNNIIPFKQKTLTENEINSLFLGLVKLIKKNAIDEAFDRTKSKELEIRRANMALCQREREIELLKEELGKLKAQNNSLSRALKSPSAKKILQRQISGKKLSQQSAERI